MLLSLANPEGSTNLTRSLYTGHRRQPLSDAPMLSKVYPGKKRQKRNRPHIYTFTAWNCTFGDRMLSTCLTSFSSAALLLSNFIFLSSTPPLT